MKFRLQNVLDYRERLEDQAQQRLAQMLARQLQLQQWRDAARTELERLDDARRRQEREGMTVADMQLYQARLEYQRQQLAKMELALRAADEQVAQRQAELLQARQDREAMELLKAKNEERQRQRQRQEETRQLDEVGSRGRQTK